MNKTKENEKELANIYEAREKWLIENSMVATKEEYDAKMAEFDEQIKPFSNSVGDGVANKMLNKYLLMSTALTASGGIMLVVALQVFN